MGSATSLPMKSLFNPGQVVLPSCQQSAFLTGHKILFAAFSPADFIFMLLFWGGK
jgi:hypothetical protein